MFKTKKARYWLTLPVSAVSLAVVMLILVESRAALSSRVSRDLDHKVPDSAFSTFPNQLQNQRIEVEPITLRRDGFEPGSIMRSHGRFILAVDNRSRLENLVFVVERINGNRQAERRMRGRELRWRPLLNLSPGEYILTETTHLEWRCAITISAQ